MRKSKVRAKLRENRFARVCALGHFLPFFVRYAAYFNYDALWLDLEHRAMGAREVQTLLAFCHRYDIDCMVRPSTRGRTHLYRYLEDGASGFMIPFVETAAEAAALVQSIKFPPLGNRGLDGAGLDSDFGVAAWRPNATYLTDANEETFIVAQIETPEAVANAAQIAAVPGIDLLFIGPGDLNIRLPSTMTTADVVEQVRAAAQQHDKAWGIAVGTLDDVKRYRKLGAQMIPWGGDFALMKVLQTCSQELDTVA